MSPDKLLSISNLPFILHDHATAATERLDAIGAYATFQPVQLPDPGPVDRCKYRYSSLASMIYIS